MTQGVQVKNTPMFTLPRGGVGVAYIVKPETTCVSAEALKSSQPGLSCDHVPRPWYLQWLLSREQQGTEMSRLTEFKDYLGSLGSRLVDRRRCYRACGQGNRSEK